LLALAASNAWATPTFTVLDVNPSVSATTVEGIGPNGSVQGFAAFPTGYGAFTTGANGVGLTNLGSIYPDSPTAQYFAQANGQTAAGATTVLLASYNPQNYTGTSTTSLIVNADGSLVPLSAGYVQSTSSNGHYAVANEQDLSAYYYDTATSAPTRVGDASDSEVLIQGVNTSGQVVGYLYGPTGENGFITGPHNGAMTLLGAGANGTGLIVDAVNASGVWAGSEINATGSEYDLAESGPSGIINLGSLTPGGEDIATGINASGEISGYDQLASGDVIGFLYENGSFINIDTVLDAALGTTVSHTDVLALDDAGQAVVQATLADGSTHGYLLTPQTTSSPTGAGASVPAPAGLGLLAMGLLGLIRRRSPLA
jgi:MYXO-CTERM domain-containing protein